jgi:hypothetical protein
MAAITMARRGARPRGLAPGTQRIVAAMAVIFCAVSALAGDVPGNEGSAPIKIAVFDFELEDFSAARRAEPNPVDSRYLTQATEEARRKLAGSGRYALVDTTGADLAEAKGHGLRNCRGCDAPIAGKLGADQAMIGVVTKISMTEYTVTVQVSDARKGSVIKSFSTGLRIGAGYSWARGVTWLMTKRVLASREKQ